MLGITGAPATTQDCKRDEHTLLHRRYLSPQIMWRDHHLHIICLARTGPSVSFSCSIAQEFALSEAQRRALEVVYTARGYSG